MPGSQLRPEAGSDHTDVRKQGRRVLTLQGGLQRGYRLFVVAELEERASEKVERFVANRLVLGELET